MRHHTHLCIMRQIGAARDKSVHRDRLEHVEIDTWVVRQDCASWDTLCIMRQNGALWDNLVCLGTGWCLMRQNDELWDTLEHPETNFCKMRPSSELGGRPFFPETYCILWDLEHCETYWSMLRQINALSGCDILVHEETECCIARHIFTSRDIQVHFKKSCYIRGHFDWYINYEKN
jgi:hypothetical protein